MLPFNEILAGQYGYGRIAFCHLGSEYHSEVGANLSVHFVLFKPLEFGPEDVPALVNGWHRCSFVAVRGHCRWTGEVRANLDEFVIKSCSLGSFCSATRRPVEASVAV